MITLDRATLLSKPPAKPNYTPHGYLIQPDGSTYALCAKWWHGVGLALLYPDTLKSYIGKHEDEAESLTLDCGFDDVDAFAFQRYEFAAAPTLPVIRIANTRVMSDHVCVDLPRMACPSEQTGALMLLLYGTLGLSAHDMVETDLRETPIKDLLVAATRNSEDR